MLVVMHSCSKDNNPERALKRKPDNINNFTNIVTWKGKAYRCGWNQKAKTDILEYFATFTNALPPLQH
jgi:hypothetical protein